MRRRLKKKILYLFITLVLITIGIYSYVNINNRRIYESTNEYKLLQLGYSKKDTNAILKDYQSKEIEYILNNEVNDIYLDLFKEKYFIYDNFYKYLDYYDNNKELSLTNIIEIINTNRDRDYYTDPIKTDTSKNELIIVNKYYHLDSDFKPDNLVGFNTTYAYGNNLEKKVTKETYDAYLNMWNDSNKAGFYLMVSSAYRDYDEQKRVYDDYEKRYNKEYADDIAARPGFSEHQTGLALDIFEKGYTQKNFQDSKSYEWLIDNSYKYGFILRYPKDKENITGYKYESWHFRYVGIKAATYIHDNNITFDEYYTYFVK